MRLYGVFRCNYDIYFNRNHPVVHVVYGYIFFIFHIKLVMDLNKRRWDDGMDESFSNRN